MRRRRTVAALSVVTLTFLAWQAQALGGSGRPVAAPATHTSLAVAAREALRAPRLAAPLLTTKDRVYAHAGVGDFAPATRTVPYLLYVPESSGNAVDVVDPLRKVVIGHYVTGLDPQHVVPSYDLKTLWSTNDLANTVTPFDPRTGMPRGPAMAVDDPYNLYFLPGGKEAMVVQEQRQQFGFYDAQTMTPSVVVHLDCPGLDHADFSADLRTVVASCEFGHRLVRFDVRSKTVLGYLDLPGSAPQDVRLGPDGREFYVADRVLGGVFVIDARTFTKTGFVPTGPDAHGIYPSRDGRRLYVSNRGNGTISVLDPFLARVVSTWRIPGGGSPDMGGVSPDGKSLWLSGRYDAKIYQVSTFDGHLMATVRVPHKPHGMCVWPQPGRFSLGHTGNMR